MIKVFIILFFISSVTSAQQFHFRVPGTIPVLKQPKSMDCWITVTAMMLSWHDSTTYTVSQIANKLADPWKLYYDMNTGLPQSDQAAFVKRLQLKTEPPANYTPGAYLDFLREFGPIWIITGDLLGAHARLLIGMEGDNAATADFILIDPLVGKEIRQNSIKFLIEFEEEAKIANKQKWKDLAIQIFHF